ncbi:hypothetical protein ABZ800_06550, partial [Streptomyces sp. NPDC047813]|uniref:hypothetical protein n=1 Tax=Streptomyces sp. NPDC047813 TaxID=3154608 RepID=UPI00340E3A3C
MIEVTRSGAPPASDMPDTAGDPSGKTPRPRPFRLDQSIVGLGVPLTDVQWSRIEPLLPDR